VLSGCGGNNNSSGNVALRLVNATLTHASLDLSVNSGPAISAVGTDGVSAFAAPASGTDTLQVNDTGGVTALATTTAVLSSNAHYTVLAYESRGAVQTEVLTEDFAAPTSGTAQLRIYDAAIDAGSLDVYLTGTATDLAGVASPTLTILADAYAASSGWTVYSPGTYRLRVTGAGNKADLRIDMPVTLVAGQSVSALLTPASGGLLLNGSTLVQQGDNAATRNTTARVRLAAAVSGGATVSATAGATAIGAGSVAVGSYVVVPATGVLAVNVNGSAVAPPAAGLTAGADATLLVYGSPTTAAASLVADDNRRPATSTNVRMRLLNAMTGQATALSLAANFSPLATGVAPGAASSYGLVAGSTSMRLDVTSDLSSAALYSESALNIGGDSVYTLFMLGDASAPQHVLRKDR